MRARFSFSEGGATRWWGSRSIDLHVPTERLSVCRCYIIFRCLSQKDGRCKFPKKNAMSVLSHKCLCVLSCTSNATKIRELRERSQGTEIEVQKLEAQLAEERNRNLSIIEHAQSLEQQLQQVQLEMHKNLSRFQEDSHHQSAAFRLKQEEQDARCFFFVSKRVTNDRCALRDGFFNVCQKNRNNVVITLVPAGSSFTRSNLKI